MMKGDKECEDHDCEYLKYCKWHPEECYGKPWNPNPCPLSRKNEK
jgi:hypothetical protein